jgi:hypothetical protein
MGKGSAGVTRRAISSGKIVAHPAHAKRRMENTLANGEPKAE